MSDEGKISRFVRNSANFIQNNSYYVVISTVVALSSAFFTFRSALISDNVLKPFYSAPNATNTGAEQGKLPPIIPTTLPVPMPVDENKIDDVRLYWKRKGQLGSTISHIPIYINNGNPQNANYGIIRDVTSVLKSSEFNITNDRVNSAITFSIDIGRMRETANGESQGLEAIETSVITADVKAIWFDQGLILACGELEGVGRGTRLDPIAKRAADDLIEKIVRTIKEVQCIN